MHKKKIDVLHCLLLQMVQMNMYNISYVIGWQCNNMHMHGILLLWDIVRCNIRIEHYYYNTPLGLNTYTLYGYINNLNIYHFFITKGHNFYELNLGAVNPQHNINTKDLKLSDIVVIMF